MHLELCFISMISILLLPYYCEAISKHRRLPAFVNPSLRLGEEQVKTIDADFIKGDETTTASTDTSQHIPQLPPFLAETMHFNRFERQTEMNSTPSRRIPFLERSTSVSVSVMFVLFIWRLIASYEMADQFVLYNVRILAVVPVLALLLANVAALSANVFKPLKYKNTLKAIVAANIIRESVEMVYNLLVLVSSADRSEYLGRLFMNVWWSILCFSIIKTRWVLMGASPNDIEQQGPYGTGQQM